MSLVGVYHSSQPPESQGDPISQHVEEELWTKVVDSANRCYLIEYHKNFFGDNVKCSSNPSYSSSSVDRETIERLRNTVSQLTEELAEQRERQKKMEKATTSQFKKMQQQLSFFIRTAGIISSCSGDAVRAAKGLGPLDDFSTDDDMEDENEFNDDDF